MEVNKIGSMAADELSKILKSIDEAEIQRFIDAIINAKRVFFSEQVAPWGSLFEQSMFFIGRCSGDTFG